MRSGVALAPFTTPAVLSGEAPGQSTTSHTPRPASTGSPAAAPAVGTSRTLWLLGCSPQSWMTAHLASRCVLGTICTVDYRQDTLANCQSACAEVLAGVSQGFVIALLPSRLPAALMPSMCYKHSSTAALNPVLSPLSLSPSLQHTPPAGVLRGLLQRPSAGRAPGALRVRRAVPLPQAHQRRHQPALLAVQPTDGQVLLQEQLCARH
jgi:hypothetical protein